MDRGEAGSPVEAPEQLRAERVTPARPESGVVAVIQGDVLQGLASPISKGVSGCARHELGRAQIAGGVQQPVGRRPAAGQGVLLVVLSGHLKARHLERLEATLWPARLLANHIGQHVEGLRVGEESFDVSVARPLHEGTRVVDAGVAGENLLDVRRSERVEPQRHDGCVRGHDVQPGAIVLAQPVRLPARDAKGRGPEGIEASADAVEGRAHVGGTGPHLVEAVDEERLASPSWMLGGVQRQEIAGIEQERRVAERFALTLEGGGLSRARVAEEDVRELGPECAQGL